MSLLITGNCDDDDEMVTNISYNGELNFAAF